MGLFDEAFVKKAIKLKPRSLSFVLSNQGSPSDQSPTDLKGGKTSQPRLSPETKNEVTVQKSENSTNMVSDFRSLEIVQPKESNRVERK